MKKLNNYLADLEVSYVKLHNLHWNVTGFSFKQVHEYLEELYDDRAEKFDEIAEAMKMRGILPAANVKEYLELTQIEELKSKDILGKEAISLTLEDVKKMKDLAMEIRNEADEQGDVTLVGTMEDHISGYEKEIWFMESMLK